MPLSDSLALPGPSAADVAPPPGAPREPGRAPVLRWHDGVPVLLVCLLAFLLASFPARNTDLWRDLAAGRRLAGGDFSFADPDGATPAGANHTWLYDLLAYGLHALVGGSGLVVVKALVVVGLALVLLRLSRTGPGWWAPAACTALALLAMSVYLMLRPATISYLFLAWTLSRLRPRAAEERGVLGALGVPLWPLLVLFAAWTNLDDGFALGLAVVALVGVGRLLDGAGKGAATLSRAAGLAVCLALLGAACLLNPSFFLYPTAYLNHLLPASLMASPPPGAPASPFTDTYLAGAAYPAGMAYFPLLVLGLLSFALNLPRWRWQRFLPWVGLALASAFQVRAVPYFAVAAGPVLAWNLLEILARYLDPLQGTVRRRFLAVGRILTATGCVALLVCAWPGWLQAPPYEPRQWALKVAPSLERGAATLARWHNEGKLGREARGLYLSGETADVFAWFCPEEKGVRIDRLAAAVLAGRGDWHGGMRAAQVNHVILYEPNRGRLAAGLGGLLADPWQWPLLHLEGDLAIFGWRDPGRAEEADPFRGQEVDPERLAFRPGEEAKIPRRQSAQEPEERHWSDAFWKPLPPRSIDHDEATLHLFHADSLRRYAAIRHQVVWGESRLAALAGAAGAWAGAGPAAVLFDAHLRLVLLRPLTPSSEPEAPAPRAIDRAAVEVYHQFARARDDAPPALLYLAIRAARRALAANPDDAQAHVLLGECYWYLLHFTRERAWADRLPELAQLRRAQASAALNRAVALRPDHAQAHLRLVELYLEMNYLDLALEHRRTFLRLTREAGPPPGVPVEVFQARQAHYQEMLGRLTREVEDRQNEYVVASAGLAVMERAALAFEKGLAGKARDLLLDSDISAFGPKGMALELQLLLTTGRHRDVWEWTAPQHQAQLGPALYSWLRARALAAGGDYGRAEEECSRLARLLAVEEQDNKPVPVREAMALVIGQSLLDGELREGEGALPYLLRRARSRWEFFQRLTSLRGGLKREADLTVLRGLLALEEGQVDEAEIAFREALAVWRDETAAASGAGLDFNARPIARDCLEWLAPRGKER